jgi:geranylgeranyl diphosphate synthase type II
MDNAYVRRNYPTVNVKWNQNAAILSGDAMLILAYQLISKAPFDTLPQILSLFNQTALQVCEGQQLDMNFETTLFVSVEDYLKMIHHKTAVLIAASLATGGITAKTDGKNIDTLYQFGLNIGMAFQLQDDYLDAFADNHQFGKSIGGDILANKKTYLMLSALQSSDRDLVEELKMWIKKKDFKPDEKIDTVKRIYKKLDIPEKTRNLIQEYFSSGLKFFQRIDAKEPGKEELFKLVSQIMEREH